jgi:magnesium chelatase family protein
VPGSEPWCVLGEVGLDGACTACAAPCPIAAAARRAGLTRLLVPAANAAEAALADGPTVIGVETLADAIAHLRGEAPLAATDRRRGRAPRRAPLTAGDLADVRGQASAKRALEVAARGAQHRCSWARPARARRCSRAGCRRSCPPLALDEAIEVTAIHSVAGLLDGRAARDGAPVRAPHCSISDAALLGGGNPSGRAR